MSHSNIIPSLVPIVYCLMQEDTSPQELPCITSVVVNIPFNIYQQLAVTLGGPANLMNALSPSSVDVQLSTGMHYRARISHMILPAQNPFPDHVFNNHPSPHDAGATSQFYGNAYPHYQVPSPTHSECVTRNPDTSSSGLESALGDLNNQAALQAHHHVTSLELPSTVWPILPSTSSSTTLPFNAQPPSLDGNATLPDMPFQDRQVSCDSEQSALGHQIQRPGCPRAYVTDGLLVDEEDLINGNTTYDGCIHVHECNRGDSLCGLWVKADRRSIMRHGQRWHGDAQSGGDISTTCPWLGCNRPMRANGIPRHTLSAHFGVTSICRDTGCSKVFNRHDSFIAHTKKRDCLGAALGAIVRYDTDTRVINTKNISRPSG
ncbi:hypothetical protein BDR07DRAFT_1423629 [Suillus spraguei]|nr:hypothetical protein BDR07DRAFT_1423629 [Suillus spraguei]